MTENKIRLGIGQKAILMVGIISFSALVFPFLSLILLGIMAKLMPHNMFITTLAVVIPFRWGLILGVIFGLIIGFIVISKINKS